MNNIIDVEKDYNKLPQKVQSILDRYEDYTSIEECKKDLESLGYTFDYDLDFIPYNIQKINKMSNTPDYNQLIQDGLLLDTAIEGSCFLYLYNGNKYVVLSDNSVITQEHDNAYGIDEAIFPV